MADMKKITQGNLAIDDVYLEFPDLENFKPEARTSVLLTLKASYAPCEIISVDEEYCANADAEISYVSTSFDIWSFLFGKNDPSGSSNTTARFERVIKSSDKRIVRVIKTLSGSLLNVIKAQYYDIKDNLILEEEFDDNGNFLNSTNFNSDNGKENFSDGIILNPIEYFGDKAKCVKEVCIKEKTGSIINQKYLDNEGYLVYEIEYDRMGNIVKTWCFNSDRSVGLSTVYNKDGSINEVHLFDTTDKNIENDVSWRSAFYDDTFHRLIFEKSLFDYSQFSADETYELMFLPALKWQIVKSLLEENKEVSMKQIREAIYKK